MGLKKNVTRLYPHRKNEYWLQYYYGTQGLEKNSIGTRKNIYFRFLLQYYYDAWHITKNQSHGTITEKKIFLFLTTVVLRCTGLSRNFVSR